MFAECCTRLIWQAGCKPRFAFGALLHGDNGRPTHVRAILRAKFSAASATRILSSSVFMRVSVRPTGKEHDGGAYVVSISKQWNTPWKCAAMDELSNGKPESGGAKV